MAAMMLLTGLAAGGPAPLNAELLVTDGANARDLAAYPVKVGVPLARGAYEDTAKFRLVDAAGTDVPAQFDVMARYWPDSWSIRGVLVSFNAAVKKGGVTSYFLRDDGAGAPVRGLVIDETPEGITVNTGPLRFTVNKRAFNVVDQAWYDINRDGVFAADEQMLAGGGQSGPVLNGVEWGAARSDVRFEWEYRGPLYAVLKAACLTEAKTNGWGFICRIHMFKDQSFVVADYTLKNSAYGATGHHLDFKSFVLTQGLKNIGEARARLGGTPASAFEGALDRERRMLADRWKHFSVNGAEQPAGLALGYADVSDTGKGLLMAVRKLGNLWPCGIKIGTDKSVTVELWPEGEHQLVDQARRSHQILYCFHPGDWDAGRVAQEAQVFERWPVAFMKPSWYAQTRAFFDFGGIVAPQDEFDASAFTAPRDYPPDKDGNETGWWNWGGSNWRRVSSTTGGMPGDLTGVMASGMPGALYRGDDVARHHAEMRPMWCDDYQYPRDAALNFNATYPPNVGLRPPKARRDNSTVNWSSWDDMHPWVYEVGDYYWYTGEKFCADYLTMHADYLMNLNHYASLGEPGKQPVWNREVAEPMHIIMDAYKITGHRRYWDYIQAFAERLIETKGNDFGVANNCGFQHGLISATVCELYFLLPARTPAEQTLKERVLQFIVGTGNGQFYWGGNTKTPEEPARKDTWGWAYYWDASLEKYQRPPKGEMTVQCLNERGFTYLLTGQACYRNQIGLVHGTYSQDKAGKVGRGLEGYGRVARAAWNYPQMKQAQPPEPIKDLKIEATGNRQALLSWTSTGGQQLRVFYADRPIVEPRLAFAGNFESPVTSTNPAVCDVYDARVLWTDVVPLPAGRRQQLLTSALDESWAGRSVHFAIQTLNIASPADMGRSLLSNCDAARLSPDQPAADEANKRLWEEAARASITPMPAPAIMEISCPSPTQLVAILNFKSAVTPAIRGSLVRLNSGTALPIGKIELETVSGRMLAITTTGLEQGAEYGLTLENLAMAEQAPVSPLRIVYRFRAHLAPDCWSVARKVNFGPAVGDYEGARHWDGNFGYNYPQWQWGSVDGKVDSTAAVEANLKATCIRLSKAKFGEMWFRMRVNPFVRQYRVVVVAGDAGPWTKAVSMNIEGREVWKSEPLDAKRRFLTFDQVIDISDGELEIVFDRLNYLELYPQYRWQAVSP
jgi:hypothetical protein